MRNFYIPPCDGDFLYEVNMYEMGWRMREDLAVESLRKYPEKKNELVKEKRDFLASFLHEDVLSHLPLHFRKSDFARLVSRISLKENNDILQLCLKSSHRIPFLKKLYEYCDSRNRAIKRGELEEFKFVEREVSLDRIKLDEGYKKVKFPFLDELVDKVYEDPEHIIDIFRSYDLNLQFDTFDENYTDEAVCRAFVTRKTKRITVVLNSLFLQSYLLKGKNKDLFKKELEMVLIHENTHLQQYRLAGDDPNVPLAGQCPFPNTKTLRDYYSTPGEIDAFAREVAFDLEKNDVELGEIPIGNGDKKSIERLALFCRKNHLSRITANALLSYSLYAPKPAVNRLLKEIYRYVKEED